MTVFGSRKKESKISIWGMPILLVLGIIILIVVSSSYIKVALQKTAINKEIANLKQEKEKLEANNSYLAGLLDYFASESYKEREMRLKLGMQKPGEKVIIISQEGEKASPENSPNGNADNSGFSNFKKWWNYFFGER